MRKRIWLVAGCVATLFVLAITSWLLLVREAGPIPASYAHGLDFALYYPSKLPTGYSVDQASYKREGEVLIFSIDAPGGRNIAVSQQALPTDMPARQKNNAPVELPGEKEFSTSAGQAHIGLWGEKYVADLVTQDSWIILNTTGFREDEAVMLIGKFRRLSD